MKRIKMLKAHEPEKFAYQNEGNKVHGGFDEGQKKFWKSNTV